MKGLTNLHTSWHARLEEMGVLVQLITGEAAAVCLHSPVQHDSPNFVEYDLAWPIKSSLHFSNHAGNQNIVPGIWIEEAHISKKTDEPLVAVEMDNDDIVYVPIKWLMSMGEPWSAPWTVAYHINGEAMTRWDRFEDKEFLRSVRRTDIRRILG